MDARDMIEAVIGECPLAMKHPLVLSSILVSKYGKEAAKEAVDSIMESWQEEAAKIKEAAEEMVDPSEIPKAEEETPAKPE